MFCPLDSLDPLDRLDLSSGSSASRGRVGRGSNGSSGSSGPSGPSGLAIGWHVSGGLAPTGGHVILGFSFRVRRPVD